MGRVERHLFVSEDLRDRAYDDCALPIDEGQTISQPYMVALMTELLELGGNERVLEVGTGSGYQAAVLSLLVERIRSLALGAENLLRALKYENVHVSVFDGTLGLPGHAPYDGIIVAAAAPEIPPQYIEQLKPGGRLVIPVGSRHSQVLYQVRKSGSGIDKSAATTCVFVPLIGEMGWKG